MTNIEQRSRKKYPVSMDDGGTDMNSGLRKAYVNGATEQETLDIEKSCEAYCKVCDTQECRDFDEFGSEHCSWLSKFRKTLKRM